MQSYRPVVENPPGVAQRYIQLLHPCFERRHLSCARGSDALRHCRLVLAERTTELLGILLQLLLWPFVRGGSDYSLARGGTIHSLFPGAILTQTNAQIVPILGAPELSEACSSAASTEQHMHRYHG